MKGTVMQIEKELINDRLRVSKVSWKFCIPTIYNFAIMYSWNLLFSSKVAYFSTWKQNFTAQQLKTRTAMNAKRLLEMKIKKFLKLSRLTFLSNCFCCLLFLVMFPEFVHWCSAN